MLVTDVKKRLQKYNQKGFFEDSWHLEGGNPDEAFLERDTHGYIYAVNCDKLDITTRKAQTAAIKIIPIDVESLRLPRRMTRNEQQRALAVRLKLIEKEIAMMGKLKGVTNVAYFRECTKIERIESGLKCWDVLILMDRMVSLNSYLKQNPTEPGSRARLVQALQIWNDISNALFVCENVPIIHANIKPSNIFYQAIHNVFKLGNFGISIPAATFPEGICYGTRDYMSPEMYNRQGGDVRSDMYSLAVMIYELLNGNRLPHQTDGNRAEACRIRLEEKRPVPPVEGVPAEVNAVLLKCLDADPANRYSSWKTVNTIVLDMYVSLKKKPAAVEVAEPPKKKRDWRKFAIIGLAGVCLLTVVILLASALLIS